MAVDILVERDLTFVFERDDVHAAFAGHCASTHLEVKDVRTCRYCTQLRVVLVEAIIEWLALVDQDRVARLEGNQLAEREPAP